MNKKVKYKEKFIPNYGFALVSTAFDYLTYLLFVFLSCFVFLLYCLLRCSFLVVVKYFLYGK